MRILRVLLLAAAVAVTALGCGGDDDGGNGDRGDAGDAGDGGAQGGGAGTGDDGGAAGSSAGSGGEDAGGDLDAATPDTGPPVEGELVACDITAEPDPCGGATAVCAGRAWAGFYCREECTGGAQSGDRCGTGGVCLRASPFDDEVMVCFELTDCDYVTGAGCDVAAGESCVLIELDSARRACVPSGDLAAGERCEAKAKNLCAPGTACLGSDIEDGDQGVCTVLCHPGDPLPDNCVECIDFSADLGSCAECSVLENDCDSGEACYPLSEALGGTCVQFGPGGADDLCTYEPSGSCAEGFLCLEMNDPSGPDPMVCVQTCDTSDPVCDNPDYFCNDIGVYEQAYPTGELALCRDFGAQYCMPDRGVECPAGIDCMGTDSGMGVCLTRCDPIDGNAACGDNFACIPTSNGEFFTEAFLHGNGICGTGCSDDGDCGGDTCLLIDGLEQPGTCGPTCDTGNPACGGGLTCVPTPQNAAVGACVLTAGACDPSAADDTCDFGSACISVGGSTSNGYCLPHCYLQSPDACSQYGNDCLEKVDVKWHTGNCYGTPTACDPVAQTGCDTDQNCQVLAGGAIGGHAFVCGDTGNVAENGDCSGDSNKCVLGLICVADVCRAPCDPTNDRCASGTCEDISAGYYLAADTIGACTVN
jgi:hypothetical protein